MLQAKPEPEGNVSKIGGMTRSRMIYRLKELQKYQDLILEERPSREGRFEGKKKKNQEPVRGKVFDVETGVCEDVEVK